MGWPGLQRVEHVTVMTYIEYIIHTTMAGQEACQRLCEREDVENVHWPRPQSVERLTGMAYIPPDRRCLQFNQDNITIKSIQCQPVLDPTKDKQGEAATKVILWDI